jgi:hypothetical protein
MQNLNYYPFIPSDWTGHNGIAAPMPLPLAVNDRGNFVGLAAAVCAGTGKREVRGWLDPISQHVSWKTS